MKHGRHGEPDLILNDASVVEASGSAASIAGGDSDATPVVDLLERIMPSVVLFRAVRNDQDEIVDFEWVSSNASAAKELEVDPADVTGRRLLDLFPNNREPSVFQRYVAVVETSQPERWEHHCQDPEIGGWFDLLAVKAGDGFALGLVRIGEPKATALRLRESETSLKVMLNAIPEVALLMDRSGTILQANEELARRLGGSVDELLGCSVYEKLGDEALAEQRRRHIDQVFRTGRRYRFSDERRGRMFETLVSPVFDEAGRVSRVAVLSLDVTDRRRAEARLVESRQFLQAALDALPANVAILDPAGTIVAVNRAWRQFAQANDYAGREYGLGTNYLDLCRAARASSGDDQRDLAGQAWQGLADLLAGRCDDFALEYPCTDPKRPDQIRAFLLRAAPLFRGGQRFAVVSHTDISERVRVERALAESEERLRAFFGRSPAGLFVVDADYRYLAINPTLADINGLAPEAHLGRSLREVLPSLVDQIEPMFERVLRRGEVLPNVEIHGKTPQIPDVDRVWVCSLFPLPDADGKPKAMGGVVIEITDRKRAEKQLRRAHDELEVRVNQRTADLSLANQKLQHEMAIRERAEQAVRQSEERLQLAFEAANEGMFDHHVDTGWIYWSPRYYTMLGYEPYEFEPSMDKYIEMLHPDDRERTMAMVGEYLAGGDIPGENEYRMRTKDGGYRWIWGKGQTVERDEHGRPRRLIGVHVDITPRREAEERARRHLEQLAHVARLGVMGEMATGLAHELNQPLGAIINYAEACSRLVRQGTVQPDMLAEHMEQVSQQARRAGEVIRHMRDFVRRRETAHSAVDPVELVHEILGVMRVELSDHAIEIEVSASDVLPMLSCDPIQIQQVLINLLRNAVDALTQAPPDRPHIDIVIEPGHGGTLRIVVRDNGPGFPSDMARKLFSPFFSTKDGGMGMGLSISQSIVEAHHGRLSASCPAEGGAVFTIELPAQESRGPQ